MTPLCRVLFALALLATPIAPAAAFTSGIWQGGPNTDANGMLSDCTMTAQAESGILLAFVISRDGEWGLALADERWKLNVGNVQDVELTIDGRPPLKAIAKVVDPHGILVPLANDDALVAAMRNGKILSISTGTGTFSFELTGTSGALSALADCVAQNLSAGKVANPVPPQGKRRDEVAAVDAKPNALPDTRENRLFTESEASAFAGELLASAGVSGYRLIDPSQNPMPSFDAVWSYPNGIVGAVAAFKGAGGADLEQVAATIAGDDARNCEGSFTSGVKPRAKAADQAWRFFTACRSAGRDVEIHYTLLSTEGGNLIQIAHLNRGDSSLDIADADSAFLASAALKNVK